jgi:hypothetical protein
VWRDYIGVVPSTAAIVNGFIAVLVAQFFKERPKAKLALVIVAGVLGVAAVGMTFYGQSQIVAARIADENHHHYIRDSLGSYIERGNKLENELSDPKKEPSVQVANNWDSDVVGFLQSNLGESYVVRYRDQTGIPPLSLNGADPAHQNLWWGIYIRVFRLEQFIEQVPTQ